jgi:transposase-like protein
MTGEAKRTQYPLEFKLEAVRLVKAGQSMAAVVATLDVVEQTLYNRRLSGGRGRPIHRPSDTPLHISRFATRARRTRCLARHLCRPSASGCPG